MIRFLASDKIDPTRWEQMVLNTPEALVYSCKWYLDAVSAKWGALILNDYEAALPLVYKARPGFRNVYQPFFNREHTFLFSGAPDPLSASLLLDAIPSKFHEIDFCLSPLEGLTISPDFSTEEYVHQELRLDQEYKKIKESYSTNAKRLLKKAEDLDLRLVSTSEYKEVTRLFRSQKGGDLKDLKTADYKRLDKLMREAITRRIGKVYKVELNGEVLAIGFFLFFKGRLTYLKGTVTDEGRKLGAMYFMFDQLIWQHVGEINVFDFGGSRVTAVATFYRKFGSVDRRYFHLKKGNAPLLINFIKKLRK